MMSKNWAWIVFLCTASVHAAPVHFTLLHTNDTHTHLLGGGRDGAWGGLARMATQIDQVRAEGQPVLLLDAGDWSEGTPFHFAAGAGSWELEAKDLLGYDAVVVGNHDYLYDPAFLVSKLQGAMPSYPVLLANVDASAVPELEPLLVPYTVWSSGELDVGIFGLTTDEILYTLFFEPALVTDPLVAAQTAVGELAGMGCEMILCLSHLGTQADVELAETVDGIDLIVGGHSHDLLWTPRQVTGPSGEIVYLVQAGEWYRYLGRLDLMIDPNDPELVVESATILPTHGMAEDPTAAAFVADRKAEVEATLGPIFGDDIAQAAVDLPSPSAECSLGNLAADAFLDAAREAGHVADLSVTTGNFLARGLQIGSLSTVDAIEVCPYGYDPIQDRANTLVVGGLSGLTIKLALVMAASLGQAIHVSDLTGVVDFEAGLSGDPELYVGGAPLSNDQIYRVVMNSTEAVALQAFGIVPTDVETTDLECWRVLAERFTELGTLDRSSAPLEGRVRSLQPDLFVHPEEITFHRHGESAGEGVTVLARLRNLGEQPAAAGRVTFYEDPTPEDETDDPRYDPEHRIGSFDLPGVPAYGQPGRGFAWTTWDTTGRPVSDHHRIRLVIEDVQSPEGDLEVLLGNNRTASPSTGEPLTDEAVGLDLRLFMPTDRFSPGDTCGLDVVISRPGGLPGAVPLFVLLDVHGEFYFGPSWSHYSEEEPTLDYWMLEPTTGVTTVHAVPPFIWPDTGGDHAEGLYFHAAILDPSMTEILGSLVSLEFGF